MKQNKFKIISPAIVLLVICFAISASLALTNALTVKKIAALQEKASAEAMRELIAAEEYSEIETTYKGKDYTVFAALDGGEKQGYIVTLAQNGYGGEVSVMTAVSNSGEIIGIKVLDVSNETPGLGQNAANSSFTKQFKGAKESLKVGKNIDAVTGATITSKAVTSCADTARKIVLNLPKSGGEQ